MRYGIFSDIHGNLEALAEVLVALKKESINTCLCLGDIVGYGADPQKCIEIVKNTAVKIIAGNHDWAVIEKIKITHFNIFAQEAVLWTKDHLHPQGKQFLENLPLRIDDPDFIMVHGTLQSPEEFYYLTDKYQAAQTFYLMDRPICFVGHTHIPQIILEYQDQIYLEALMTIDLKPLTKYIVNVGSVGQPRDGNPQAAYFVYDSLKISQHH